MKKQSVIFLTTITFLFFGVFMFVNQVRAETEVSGNITSDTIWILANSPYVVTGTVQILQGAKLTIEPGVVIKFNQNTGLNIDGELHAVGLVDNLIIFTSNSVLPTKGHWNGIKFFSNAIGASFNDAGEYASGSIIKYSKIEYGGKSEYNGNISTSGGNSLFVSDSIILYGAYYGIYIDSTSNSKIIRSHIENNGGTSVWSGGIAWIASQNITIKQNSIINNSTGILAANLSSNDFISYNNIHNNSLYNFKFIVPQSLKTYNIKYNYWGSVNKTTIDSKIYDYYDDISLSKVDYEPYAFAELKFDGTDTFSQLPVCTSWTFSDWSSCSSNGQQTRSTIYSFPSGCTDGNPVLTQSCTYIAPACTSWTYFDWSTCQYSGTKTRTIISSSPNGCSGGNPTLTQSCIYTPPTCTSWVYSDWGACINNQQTRIITSSSQPANCMGGNPVLNQSCNYQIPTCTNFSYSSWGECNSSGVQSRTILSSIPSNCVGGNPVLNQSCQKEIKIENVDVANNSNQINNNNGAESQTVIAEEKKLTIRIDNNLSKRMNGNILLQVEKNGEGWYVYPDDKKKYYLGRPADAFSIMRNLGLGIKHNELTKYLNSKFSSKLSGKILLDVEKNGEAYYVNPKDLKGYFLNRPADAFKVMRNLGLGITNTDIRKIGVGEIK